MFRLVVLMSLAAILLSACGAGPRDSVSPDAIQVKVFKSPYCSCCGGWIAYMEQNGFKVIVEEVESLAPIKARYQVPPELESCHTAIVEGYVVEGHVPAREIERMLAERPEILGLAVAGMPVGSPGMEGSPAQPFQVIAFDREGGMQVYAAYPEK